MNKSLKVREFEGRVGCNIEMYIKTQYMAGKKVMQLAREIGIASSGIVRYLNILNIKRRTDLSSEDVVKSYIAWQGTIDKTAKEFKCSRDKIKRILIEKKIKFKHSTEYMYEKYNDHVSFCFEEPDTIESKMLEHYALALYKGEGSKTLKGIVMTNTDCIVHQIWLKYLREIYQISESKLRVQLQIDLSDDEDKIKQYWSDVLIVPLLRFHKSIKRNRKKSGSYKNKAENGVCSVGYFDTYLRRHLLERMDRIGQVLLVQ